MHVKAENISIVRNGWLYRAYLFADLCEVINKRVARLNCIRIRALAKDDRYWYRASVEARAVSVKASYFSQTISLSRTAAKILSPYNEWSLPLTTRRQDKYKIYYFQLERTLAPYNTRTRNISTRTHADVATERRSRRTTIFKKNR